MHRTAVRGWCHRHTFCHAPVIVNLSLLLHPRSLLHPVLGFLYDFCFSLKLSPVDYILWILILQSLSHSLSLLVFATRSIVWN